MTAVAISGFDYAAIPPDLAKAARAAANRIRARLNESYVATGRDLVEVKARLNHGQFGAWLKAEFGMTERTAENYMNAARWLDGKSETLSFLPPTILYALAAPSAPPAVVAEVVESADAGSVMPPQDIKQKLAAAAEADRRAKIEAAKSPEQVKREKANAARRVAAEKAQRQKWQEENEARVTSRNAAGHKAAEFLIEHLDTRTICEFLMMMRETDWQGVQHALRQRGILDCRYLPVTTPDIDLAEGAR